MEDLGSMKYADLRKLAKKVGVKGNVKQEKLIEKLKNYYSNCDKNENANVVKCTKEQADGKKKPQKSSIDPTFKNTAIQNQQGLAAGKSVVGRTKALQESAKTPAVTSKVQEKRQKLSCTKSSERRVKKVFTVNARSCTKDTSNKAPTLSLKPEIGKRKIKSALESQPPSKRQKRNLETTASPDLPFTMVDCSGDRSTSDKTAIQESLSIARDCKVINASEFGVLSSAVDCPTDKPRRNTFVMARTPKSRTPEIAANTSNKSKVEKAPTQDVHIPEIEVTLPKKVTQSSASPAVKEMLGAMDSNMTNEQMKKSLMSVIDKNVQEKVKVALQESHIPRFAQNLKKINKSKPITPGNKNWRKIHKKNFDKFDSIDIYLEKKQKHIEEMTSTVKKAKTILSEVHSVVDKLRSNKTPPEGFANKFIKPRESTVTKRTPFQPTVLNTSKMNLNFGAKKPSPKTLPRKSPISIVGSQVKNVPALPQGRKSVASICPAKPTILSTTKMNLDFGAKKPSPKTLPRKSPISIVGSQVKNVPALPQDRSMRPVKLTTTPFKFTAVASTTMNTTGGSAKKAFNLKASLARPLTWKPHKGKLKPMGSYAESPVYLKVHTNEAKAKRTLVNRKVARAKVSQSRADKKHDAHMAQRGIKL